MATDPTYGATGTAVPVESYPQRRGELTQRIKDKSMELMGREVSVKELRLMNSALYTMFNDQRIKPQQINQDERDILRLWKDAGYMEGGASGMAITREFYTILTELLWLGYVDLHDGAAAS